MITDLTQLWYVDQPGEVLEVRALVVELPETVVLRVITLPERLKRLLIVGSYTLSENAQIDGITGSQTSIHRPQHARNEAVDAIALFDKRDKCRYSALVVDGMAEMSKDQLLERFDLIL